jgi:TRAP-type C4-dicarboxylate transport system permease small subunit
MEIVMSERRIEKKGWFEKFKKRIHRVNRFIAGVGACFLIPLMIITAGDVVGRDVFNHPIPGTVELSQCMLAVLILLGLAYTQQVKAHVGVSVVTSRLPHPAQLILRVVATLLCLFISCILVWQGWVIGIEEKTVSDMLRVPQYPFRLLVAVGAFLTGLELVIDLGDSLAKMMGKAS